MNNLGLGNVADFPGCTNGVVTEREIYYLIDADCVRRFIGELSAIA